MSCLHGETPIRGFKKGLGESKNHRPVGSGMTGLFIRLVYTDYSRHTIKLGNAKYGEGRNGKMYKKAGFGSSPQT